MSLLSEATKEYNAKKDTAKQLIDETFKSRYMYALWRKHLKAFESNC